MKKNIFVLASFVLSLTGCNSSNNKVVIFTAAEDERIAFLKTELDKKFPEYDIVIQSMSTGAMYSKLSNEKHDTECDIFYDFEVGNAMRLLNGDSNIFADLSSLDYSIYDESVFDNGIQNNQFMVNCKTDAAFIVNTKVLQQKNIAEPTSWNDLLDSKYKGLIEMSNPKSSGTGYCIYNGLVSLEGMEAALTYFDSLNVNIKEFTTSGAAPLQDVVRGDVAVGTGMLWELIQAANSNNDLKVVQLDKGLPYNLYTMGMVKGHETKKTVNDVYVYLYSELNQEQCSKFNPDKIYKNQKASQIANYPSQTTEIPMKGLYDPSYKQSLLDSWKY